MSEKKEEKVKTYVITAAQGIQNPYSARMYGKDDTKGAPNTLLIENIENYVKINNAELQIHSIVGANCNEIELHPFFHPRNDVYIESDSKKRNLQNRVKESTKRDNYDERKVKWVERERKKERKKVEKDMKRMFREYGGTEEYGSFEYFQEIMGDEFEVMEVSPENFPHQMPMHYFWEEIPDTDWPLIGMRLNRNIHTANIPLKPQNKMPLTGKEFLTKRYGGNSVVLASPKRMMIPVAKGASGDYPHLMITTGACTHPNYNFGDLGYIAREEHRYGFTTIDVLDEKIFLPRIVPAHKNGTFIDLGIKNRKEQWFLRWT